MKNQLNILYSLAVICCALSFTSCSDDSFEGIQDNVDYQELAEFFETIDSWQSKDYTNLDVIDFKAIVDPADLCPTEYYELINFEGYEEIQSFSKSLGFLNTLKLNDWYAEFGSTYKNLIEVYNPADNTAFIDQVTEMHLDQIVSDCELPIFKELANRSLVKANTSGFNERDHAKGKCQGAALYGHNSSVHLVYKSLKKREACNQ